MRFESIYPDTFAHTITSTYGTKGVTWLAQLPQLIKQCAKQWQLTQLCPVANLTYNYVLFGMQDGIPIVLKLRCEAVELAKEVAALTAFQNHGCVTVRAHDTDLGALLLQRVIPGDALTILCAHDDAHATRIAANVIGNLHQASPIGEFPRLQQVLPDLSKEPQELAPFLSRARALKTKLLTTQYKSVLLHGDFHHGNILSAGNDQWLVIDPEGIIGDPVYDVAVYIRNPLKELVNLPNSSAIIANRIRDFAQLLGYDAQHIADWVYVQATCSAYWSLEDGLDVKNHVKFLQLVEHMQIFNQ